MLADDDHDTIVQQMVIGGIAPAEEIHRYVNNISPSFNQHPCRALEQDDYSHVTATYYLLAERVLRSQREAQAQTLAANALALAKSNPELHSPNKDVYVVTCRVNDIVVVQG